MQKSLILGLHLKICPAFSILQPHVIRIQHLDNGKPCLDNMPQCSRDWIAERLSDIMRVDGCWWGIIFKSASLFYVQRPLGQLCFQPILNVLSEPSPICTVVGSLCWATSFNGKRQSKVVPIWSVSENTGAGATSGLCSWLQCLLLMTSSHSDKWYL